MGNLNKTDIQLRFLTEEEIKLKLLLNVPIDIGNGCLFKSPKIVDIISMTESDYNKCLSAILFDKSSLGASDLDDVSNFEVLMSILYSNEEFRNYFLDGIKLHIDDIPLISEEGLFFIGDSLIVNEEIFNYIVKLVKIANNIVIEKKEELDFANERARKFMEEQAKRKALVDSYKKKKVTLYSMLSGIGWITSTFKDLGELTIYQIYEANSRIHKIESIKNINRGISAGVYDGSKLKDEELDFTSVINTK